MTDTVPHKKILNTFIRQESSLTFLESKSWPSWLKESQWRPDFVLSGKDDSIIATEVAPSGSVPYRIYRKVVYTLLKNHSELKVRVCLPRKSFEESAYTANFCQKLGVEVWLSGFGLGLERLSSSSPPTERISPVSTGIGQFPQAILDRAKGLKRLLFFEIIDSFVNEIPKRDASDARTLALVEQTVDKLLQCHPHFRATVDPFMRLVSFETLLNMTSTKSSDHVFHSFRVFLAGCPIINQFYDQFSQCASKCSICAKAELRVEYIWLLAALFHDIGRTKEGLKALIVNEIQDEEISITGKPSRWTQDRYQRARRILGSLGAFMAARIPSRWDGGVVDDHDGINLSSEWMEIYNGFDRHGVISACDFLADIMGKLTAVGEREHRRFMISHAPLAALAVLLHDWRIWEDAKRWKLIPVDIRQNPLAALLIYIDTWDDYKRKPGDPLVSIKEYEISAKGARVVVEWENENALHDQDRKYRSFSESLIGGPPRLRIETVTKKI